jgi:ParB family chromosome partitioning protein
MEHAKQLLSIPLSNLVPSPHNARRHTTTHVEELAALIDAQGLLQNLVVTEHVIGRGKARKVRFAVAAGERRRRAMLLLQQRGRLPDAHEVLCELVPPERGLEVSLAENSAREAMHPADEFEAFSKLIAEGKGVEDVASRFGVSPLIVQRRLKLAALSPKLLALYREDGINLDQLMALTLSDDHAVQERTWFDAQPWNRTPAALRQALTASDVEASGSAVVRFVGIEDYEAAGGIVRRDLFDDEQSGYLTDPDLLRRLAQVRLDAIADAVRAEGWAWAEARIELDSTGLRQFAVCPHTTREPSEQEQAALSELDARDAELEEQSEAMDAADEWSTDEAERVDLEQQDIAIRRKAIRDGMRTWSSEAMAHAGVIVTIGREGDPEIIRGLVREGDRKSFLARERQRDQGAACAATSDDDQGVSPARTATTASGHSEALVRRLTAHRTAALQAMLSQNVQVALATLAHALVHQVFGESLARPRSALQVALHLPKHQLLGAADDLEASRAWQALAGLLAAWRQRLPEEPAGWLPWLVALPQADLLDLLALCTAATLNAMASRDAAHDADAVADALGLDMADWWEPTAAGYLKHVAKAQIVQALKEAGADLAADGVGAMKKDVLVAKAAERLAGKRWLPAPLRPKPLA